MGQNQPRNQSSPSNEGMGGGANQKSGPQANERKSANQQPGKPNKGKGSSGDGEEE
jgi:hypothetical protein